MSDLLPLTNDKKYDQDFDGSEFEYVMVHGWWSVLFQNSFGECFMFTYVIVNLGELI